MKHTKILFSLVVLIAVFLTACSSQAAPTEVMPEKDMAAETMEEKDDAMMSDQDDQMTEGEKDQMSDEDDAMTEAKDDEMMSGKDDQMAVEDKESMADDEMMSDQDDQMMSEKDDQMSEKDDAMMEDKEDEMADDGMMAEDLPDWFKAALTDARTGETFAIADFKGKVVLVETLAMWCSNCLKQQGQVQALHELIGGNDDFVSLGVDIDPNEDAAALSSYIDKNGFGWLYTVAPAEVAREIGQLYGDQYLNPPSTPMLIIDREGQVHLLPFGIKSAESLLEALQPFLDAGM
jgi:cytochrome oxidase Cu insertion factor (SCO1/SenC/PrrC family)